MPDTFDKKLKKKSFNPCSRNRRKA